MSEQKSYSDADLINGVRLAMKAGARDALAFHPSTCENEDGRRGAGNTTDGLTHHSPTREGGLS